jgi:hypothetical protein
MNVEPSCWLDETFIFKIVCHHFQHKNLGASSYCVRIEIIKIIRFIQFFVHAWMKLGKIIVDVTISQPLTWVFQLSMSSRKFSKSRKNPFFIFQK